MSPWAVVVLLSMFCVLYGIGLWLICKVLLATIASTVKILDPEPPVIVQPESNQAEDMFVPDDWSVPEPPAWMNWPDQEQPQG